MNHISIFLDLSATCSRSHCANSGHPLALPDSSSECEVISRLEQIPQGHCASRFVLRATRVVKGRMKGADLSRYHEGKLQRQTQQIAAESEKSIGWLMGPAKCMMTAEKGQRACREKTRASADAVDMRKVILVVFVTTSPKP